MGEALLIGVRFGMYLTLAALFGLAAFGIYGLRIQERGTAIALRLWLVPGAALGLIFSVVWLPLEASLMADLPLWPIDQGAVEALVADPSIGTAWSVRVAMLALAMLGATQARRSGIWLGVVTISSGAALASLAWTGHGAVDAGVVGWVHLIADIFHLISAGVWVGALLGLLLLACRSATRVNAAHLKLTHRVLLQFGAVGTVIVATLIITGLINSFMLVGLGNVITAATSRYGRLLIWKLAIFLIMLAIASLNRFWITPGFEQSVVTGNYRRSLMVLRTSLLVEIAFIVLIIAVVTLLGIETPPVSIS
jgi:putative copper resistance protein D